MQQQQQLQAAPPHIMTQVPPQLPLTANITTELIQKYLDENQQLIVAIMNSQNLGKLSECAQYQAQLRDNLLFLAAIADAQTQASAAHAQQGIHYMQQPSIFPPNAAPQFNTSSLQVALQQVHMRPTINNGNHVIHVDVAHGGGDSGISPGGSLPSSLV